MTLAGRTSRRKRAGPPPHAPAAPRAADLLAWYDRNRRTLPWRVAPGEAADPYRVWLSEIMLQQTTVKAVAPYFARFLARFPDVEALALAPLEDVLRLWAGLGYYARARNMHACAQAVVERHGGRFPAREPELAALPGIGPYTAAAIAAIAFGARAVPVDGNVERLVARLFAVEDELPAGKPEIRRHAAGLAPAARAGDFAQALMDLGATICTPRGPACALCPWMDACAARARGDAESFPRKARKREGRLRRGAAFVVVRADGRMLVRSRPPKGLLGGMTEVPTSEWTHAFDKAGALREAPRLAPPLPTGEASQLAPPLPEGEVGSRSDPGEGLRDNPRAGPLRDNPSAERPHPNPLPFGEREPTVCLAGTEPMQSGLPSHVIDSSPSGATTRWRRVPGVVTHVFTHFPLELVVYTAEVPARTRAPAGARWVALAELAGEALPNVMRKVIAHALPHAQPAPAAGFPRGRQTATKLRLSGSR